MIEMLGKKGRVASRQMAGMTAEQKDNALVRLADLLWEKRAEIVTANRQDVDAGAEAGLTPAVLDRLTLNEERVAGVIADLKGVIELDDPIGQIFDAQEMPNGLKIRKQRVPLGVIAVIYEARPNVTIDVAGLALKAGNAVILRGGSETLRTNAALVGVIRQALEKSKLPVDAVQFIDSADRALVSEMLKMHDEIDMLIPRGGAALHQFCRENSLIPVMTGGIGICHLYIDESADLDAALPVIQNAKVQRPSVCNALDTILVNRAVATDFIPRVTARLSEDGVTFRLDKSVYEVIDGQAMVNCEKAGPEDFDTEWLSLVLGIKVVEDLNEAVEHIIVHSTGHSDGILTRNDKTANRFIAEVDSAAVYVNASTRYTDGAQFGLGAEVAVSTQRLHARGPMALQELTIYKYVVMGDYHVRP
jgi:glutamate-5-semialdehyde dehydrogenase